jgi:hypothetical protein
MPANSRWDLIQRLEGLITELSNFYYTRRILVWFSCFCNGFVFTTDKAIFLMSYHVTFLRHMHTYNAAQFTFLEPGNISATGFVYLAILFLFKTEVVPTISHFNLGTKFQNTVFNNDCSFSEV